MMCRIANVVKQTHTPRKLFTGSRFSVAARGHQGSSLPDGRMVDLERVALASAGIDLAGRCRTVALVVAVGLQEIPRLKIVGETIQSWLDVPLRINPSVLGDLSGAWTKCGDLIR